MILACQKLLGQITKVLGFRRTPPPHMGKTPKKSRIYFLMGSLNIKGVVVQPHSGCESDVNFDPQTTPVFLILFLGKLVCLPHSKYYRNRKLE